ncbi:MAG TPA: hypothetical protein VJ161_01005 [Geobacteraceae bacterium]|nr:hypothetical protein [Geobacteraceae bacterium]
MKLHTYALLFFLFLSPPILASNLDLTAKGGHFQDCELIDQGPSGSIKGSISLIELSSDPKWASVVAIILIQDTKPSRVFRLSLGSVSTSKKLEVRYEFFVGESRQVAEALAEIPVGEPMPFQMTWGQSQLVQLSIANTAPRNLWLDMKASRAFVLVSGSRGLFQTEGKEQIDCTRDLNVRVEN